MEWKKTTKTRSSNCRELIFEWSLPVKVRLYCYGDKRFEQGGVQVERGIVLGAKPCKCKVRRDRSWRYYRTKSYEVRSTMTSTSFCIVPCRNLVAQACTSAGFWLGKHLEKEKWNEEKWNANEMKCKRTKYWNREKAAKIHTYSWRLKKSRNGYIVLFSHEYLVHSWVFSVFIRRDEHQTSRPDDTCSVHTPDRFLVIFDFQQNRSIIDGFDCWLGKNEIKNLENKIIQFFSFLFRFFFLTKKPARTFMRIKFIESCSCSGVFPCQVHVFRLPSAPYNKSMLCTLISIHQVSIFPLDSLVFCCSAVSNSFPWVIHQKLYTFDALDETSKNGARDGCRVCSKAKRRRRNATEQFRQFFLQMSLSDSSSVNDSSAIGRVFFFLLRLVEPVEFAGNYPREQRLESFSTKLTPSPDSFISLVLKSYEFNSFQILIGSQELCTHFFHCVYFQIPGLGIMNTSRQQRIKNLSCYFEVLNILTFVSLLDIRTPHSPRQ